MSGKSILELIRAGKTRKVCQLLEDGALADQRDGADLTPLMAAACCGRTGIVQELLRRGADPNGATTEKTREASRTRDLRHLLGIGGPSVVFSVGETPLQMATGQGKHEVVELLLEAGAEVDPVNSMGWTPLFSAVYQRYHQVVGALLRHGAAANRLDAEHLSPLIHAASLGDVKLVEALLEYGADPTYENQNGDSALGHAVQCRHREAAEVLEARGAVLQQIDFTPLPSPGADQLRPQLGELFKLQVRLFPPGNRSGEAPYRLLNLLMQHLGLRSIGGKWRRLDDARAAEDLLANLLSNHLVLHHPLRSPDEAQRLAAELVGLLGPGPAEQELYTNVLEWSGDCRILMPMGFGMLDAAVVAVSGLQAAVVWTEQDD